MSSDDAQFSFEFVALPLEVVVERMNEEKSGFGAFYHE